MKVSSVVRQSRIMALLHDLRGHGPDQDSALVARRYDEGLVRGHGSASDGSAVSDADVLAHTFVVVPELEEPILSSRHVVRATLGDAERCQLALLGALKHANSLAVEGVPVCNLAIAA